jgi:hypothetical protein
MSAMDNKILTQMSDGGNPQEFKVTERRLTLDDK